jgi:hypothetical protein
MENSNNHIAPVEILMSSIVSFRDKVNDACDKILESKIGFLLVSLTIIAVSVVIIVEANSG